MNTLTNREIEIADYIAWGASVDEAADKLNISPYFIVENTFECVDSDSNEIINIPNYTVYNAVVKCYTERAVDKHPKIW